MMRSFVLLLLPFFAAGFGIVPSVSRTRSVSLFMTKVTGTVKWYDFLLSVGRFPVELTPLFRPLFFLSPPIIFNPTLVSAVPLIFQVYTKKGFGFIWPDESSDDVFVHQTSIIVDGFRSLAEGESVEYTTETDGNGRSKAVDVTGPGGVDVQGAPFRPANDDFGEW
mmetsp:Transcript_39724/g.93041  ORF Transcript_39724/g.93041 Transcript_39724/m.93041 type:complete len:166 (-) Transcript_39724:74-571(-)